MLFALEIRIEGKVFKLPVREDDTEADLVKKLAQFGKKSNGLGDRLKRELSKYIQGQSISERVKRKINNLINSNFTTNSNIPKSYHKQNKAILPQELLNQEQELNETPFKILQQSLTYNRKSSEEKFRGKRNYNYFDPNLQLNKKYEEREKSPLAFKRNKDTIQEVGKNQKNTIPALAELTRKYNALDRKCDDYILRNIKNDKAIGIIRSHQEKVSEWQGQKQRLILANKYAGDYKVKPFDSGKCERNKQYQNIQNYDYSKTNRELAKEYNKQDREKGCLKEAYCRNSYHQVRQQNFQSYKSARAIAMKTDLLECKSMDRSIPEQLERKMSCGIIRQANHRRFNYLGY